MQVAIWLRIIAAKSQSTAAGFLMLGAAIHTTQMLV